MTDRIDGELDAASPSIARSHGLLTAVDQLRAIADRLDARTLEAATGEAISEYVDDATADAGFWALRAASCGWTRGTCGFEHTQPVADSGQSPATHRELYRLSWSSGVMLMSMNGIVPPSPEGRIWTNGPAKLGDSFVMNGSMPSSCDADGWRRCADTSSRTIRAVADVIAADPAYAEATRVARSHPMPPPGDDAAHASDSARHRVPVLKPDGWTRSELVRQVQEYAEFSDTTFDRIRKEARVPPGEPGGRGQQRRYSIADLRSMIAATRQGGFRKKGLIVDAWTSLIERQASE